MLSTEARQQALDAFVEIIQFRTISGEGPLNGSYNACGAWLLKQMTSMGLQAEILPESLPNKPLVVGKWEGTSPELPCILLNSHYDVVPVVESCWTVPAFEGVRVDGRIYGRGTQDMYAPTN